MKKHKNKIMRFSIILNLITGKNGLFVLFLLHLFLYFFSFMAL